MQTKTVDAVPEFNNKIVEKGKIDTLSHKYMAAHFPGLVQVLIKWVVKLVKSGQTVTPSETLMSCKCSPHVAKMSPSHITG
jgi:hypothetical protein